MAQATPTDAAVRLGRTLNPGELAQVAAYLDDAEAKILTHLPTAVTDATAVGAAVKLAVLKAVEVSVALRAARLIDVIGAVLPADEALSAPLPTTGRANVTLLRTEWRDLGLPLYAAWSPSSVLVPDQSIPWWEIPGADDPAWGDGI